MNSIRNSRINPPPCPGRRQARSAPSAYPRPPATSPHEAGKRGILPQRMNKRRGGDSPQWNAGGRFFRRTPHPRRLGAVTGIPAHSWRIVATAMTSSPRNLCGATRPPASGERGKRRGGAQGSRATQRTARENNGPGCGRPIAYATSFSAASCCWSRHICAYTPPFSSNAWCAPRSTMRPCSITKI